MALCSSNIQEGRDGGETSRAVCILKCPDCLGRMGQFSVQPSVITLPQPHFTLMLLIFSIIINITKEYEEIKRETFKAMMLKGHFTLY